MNDPDHILIFKTNICRETDKQAICALFNADEAIEEWSLDMEDKDCVLRIVSHSYNHQHIIELINNRNFECCELT